MNRQIRTTRPLDLRVVFMKRTPMLPSSDMPLAADFGAEVQAHIGAFVALVDLRNILRTILARAIEVAARRPGMVVGQIGLVVDVIAEFLRSS